VEEEGDTTGREEVRGRDWKRRGIREDGRDQHWHTIGRSWGERVVSARGDRWGGGGWGATKVLHFRVMN
jgi:hypothetical protein